MTESITFKRLQRQDMPLFLEWAKKPHVKNTWFQEGYEEIDKYYKKIEGNGYDYGFIICLNDKPIGYIQTSDLYAYKTKCPNPRGLFTNEKPGTFCLDLFIGEENCLNKSYGTEIVRAFVGKLLEDFKAKKILIDPACSNECAIRCYEKAGFKIIRKEHDSVTECCVMEWLPNFELKLAQTEREWSEYHRIRIEEIFDRLDNVEYDFNHPSLTDPNNYHYVFYVNGKLIGAFQFELLSHNKAAMRTVVICGDNKNKGYGSMLLKLGEEEIKKHNIKSIHLHANPKAYNFYKRNGYIEMEFKDAGINEDVIDMGKIL